MTLIATHELNAARYTYKHFEAEHRISNVHTNKGYL